MGWALSYHHKVFRLAAGLAILTSIASAQPPAIGQNGVVNSASQMPPTLPGGVLARGARFIISGVRLDHGRVTLIQGTPSVEAAVVSVAPERIEAVVPGNAPLGEVRIKVERGRESSREFPVRIVTAAVGLYSRNGAGWGPGKIRNLGESVADNSFENPARPGSRISIAVTGAGGMPPALYIGGIRAKTTSLRHAAGADEIVAEIPSGAPDGCFVPVYAESPGLPPSNVITLSIHRGGGKCEMPPAFPIPLVTDARAGIVVLSRLDHEPGNGKPDWIEDDGVAAFVERSPGLAITPFLVAPPPGTCIVYTGSAQSSFTIPTSISAGILNDLGRRGLDVGAAIEIRSAGRQRVLPRTPGATGYYQAQLGMQDSRRRPLFLSPGETAIHAPGGSAWLGFDIDLPAPRPFRWTNRDRIDAIDRGKPVTVRWSGTGDTPIFIVATNVDQFTTARSMTYCVAAGRRGEFTIPGAMLANFPATYEVPGQPANQLAIATLRTVTDAAKFITAISVYANLRPVAFR